MCTLQLPNLSALGCLPLLQEYSATLLTPTAAQPARGLPMTSPWLRDFATCIGAEAISKELDILATLSTKAAHNHDNKKGKDNLGPNQDSARFGHIWTMQFYWQTATCLTSEPVSLFQFRFILL